MTVFLPKKQAVLKCPTFSLKCGTEEQYSSKENVFYGPYAHIRSRLDYSYHSNYTRSRQRFQDGIITSLLNTTQIEEDNKGCEKPTSPWIVFTAGVMGAGKRHTLTSLVKKDRFPLLSYIFVDPDEIRRHFPEFVLYTKEVPDMVSAYTRKESGYISEILTLQALDAGHNVVLDGILKDTEWYAEYFSQLRERYPKLRISVLHITVPTDSLLRRAVRRAEETRRLIPESELISMKKGVAKCALKLAPFTDYYCELRNDPGATDIEILTEGENWDSFCKHWAQIGMNTAASEEEDKRIRGKYSVTESDAVKAAVNAALSAVPFRNEECLNFSLRCSTEENYRSDDNYLYGPYAHLRAKLDYSYHSYYTRRRQCLQDAIIEMLQETVKITDINGDECTTPTEPWIVFTAGAMGAGKSHTIKSIVEKGRFPLQGFVSVDPDEIRRHLPEFLMYATLSPEKAGDLTNKECGYVSEILTLVALEAGKNVLVDGSLRDSDWYQVYFDQLRKNYPKLRIAILHVTAPRDAVYKRAEDRARVTGRVVPRETLDMALEQVPRSVQRLAPLADYCCELKNNPNAEDIELGLEGEDWDTFKSQWFQLCAWIPGDHRRHTPWTARRVMPSELRSSTKKKSLTQLQL